MKQLHSDAFQTTISHVLFSSKLVYLLTKCFLAIVFFFYVARACHQSHIKLPFLSVLQSWTEHWRSIRRWVILVGEHFLLFHFLLSPPLPPMLSVWNQSGRCEVACVTRWQWFCENSELFDCFVVIKSGVSSSHERDSLFVFLCKAVVHVGANHFGKSPVRDGSMLRLRSSSTNKAKQNKTKQQIRIFQLGLNYPFKWLISQLKAFMSRPSDCALNNNRNGRL